MWRGDKYDSVADPQHRWGLSVLEGHEDTAPTRILDAGCGSGRVTEQVLHRFGDADIVAIDTSASMLDAARNRLGHRSRLTLEQVDLGDSAALMKLGRFDAILSTGTLHWVMDNGKLFADLGKMLTARGIFVSQSGGEGSIEAVRTILDELGIGWSRLNNYASVSGTRDRLTAAGFDPVECWMTNEPVDFEDHNAFVDYLLNGVISPYVSSLNEPERMSIAEEVADRLPALNLQFVRLNIRANVRETSRGGLSGPAGLL